MRFHLLATLLLIIPSASAQQAAPAPPELTIFLPPLQAVGEDGKTAWIAQAVQQNVLNDLSRLQGVRPILPATPPADRDAAIKAAKSAGANFLLEGSYTLADPGIRITVQLLDLRTNQYIGAAKATGPLRELFALEDSIAEQVRRIAVAQVQLRAPAAAPQQQLPPVAIPGNGPVQQSQFPWDRDKPFLANEIRKTILDSEYEDSLYRTTYTYGPGSYYGYGYGGYFPTYRPVYYPRPFFRGRGNYFFSNGMISIGW
jgi:TolB-like protein